MKYLDPVTAAQLRNLSLNFQRLVAEGVPSGAHRASTKGLSQEFAQHRPYAPGDELKFLDWKLFARHDRFYTKEFEEERSLRLQLLLDASGSMAFEGKWEFACRLAMAVAYLTLAGGDDAGLAVFDTAVRDALPVGRGLPWLERIDAALAATAPERETSIEDALQAFAPRLRRRSFIVLVSDLFADPEKLISTLKILRSRKHAVLVLHVLSKSERELQFSGTVRFEDLETGAELRCDPLVLRDQYKTELERWQRLLAASFSRSEIGYEVLHTDLPWEAALKRLLGTSALRG